MSNFVAVDERVKQIRSKHFSRLKDHVYLDHAGAALHPDPLLASYLKDLNTHLYSNPHSGSPSSQSTQDIVDKVRLSILEHFNTNIEEYSVVFTSGATAAMKLLAESFQFDTAEVEIGSERDSSTTSMKPGIGGFYFLNDNHTSVLGMREIARGKGASVHFLNESDFGKTFQDSVGPVDIERSSGNNLFAFPAQSNFCGRRYSLEWIEMIHAHLPKKGKCYILLDAAGFVSSSPLDLGKYKPDFVALSFYKMFGFPTGLGALLVRNTSGHVMKKTYFGGGTLQVALPSEEFHVYRESLSERFEDGTINYLDIIALKHAFKTYRDITADIPPDNAHAFQLAKLVYTYFRDRKHANGSPIAICYVDEEDCFKDSKNQGPIVAFNILGGEGEFVGFSEVSRLAALYNIHLRTGCFCNLGDCQKHLHMTGEHVKKSFQQGHVCGDDIDLVDDIPTGAVRVSFGYYSTIDDVKEFILFVEDCFVEDGKMEKQKVHAYTETMLGALEKHDMTEDHDMSNGTEPSREMQISRCSNFNDSSKDVQNLTNGRSGIYIAQICVYPVKSCGVFNTRTWELGPKGLLYDREWMIVDETGIGIKQGKFPQMACIRPHIDTKEGVLRLDYPGFGYVTTPLQIPEPGEQAVSTVKYFSRVCTDTVESYDCGPVISEWLCNVLGSPGLHLVRQGQSHVRCAKRGQSASGRISLANEAQYLLISRSSISAFHERMEELASYGEIQSEEVPDKDNLRARFRANLVIEGDIGAYVEEQWENFRIGDTVFNVQGRCKRCEMICNDQKTGKKNREVYKTLSVVKKRKATFGILINRAECDVSAMISVGDNVTNNEK